MSFFGHQTSIYVKNEEIMFIDEHAKYNYTTSVTHGNIVYEGAIRDLGNAGKLALFTEVVDCLIGASEVEVVATEAAMESDYTNYPYYRPHTYVIHVKNSASVSPSPAESQTLFDRIETNPMTETGGDDESVLQKSNGSIKVNFSIKNANGHP